MINKKIGLLAAAILSVSSAQAAFDQGSAVFYAIDLDSIGGGSTYDTFALDLGVSADAIKNGQSIGDDIAAGAGFTNYAWGIVGTSSDTSGSFTTPGALPFLPGYTTYPNTGVLTSGAGSTSILDADIAAWVTSVDDWIADLKSVAGASTTVTQSASDPYAVNQGMTYWINGADHTTSGGSDTLSFMGGGGTSGITPAAFSNLSQTVTFDGSTVNAVPVPAAAWLFGSALAGLVVARRSK